MAFLTFCLDVFENMLLISNTEILVYNLLSSLLILTPLVSPLLTTLLLTSSFSLGLSLFSSVSSLLFNIFTPLTLRPFSYKYYILK